LFIGGTMIAADYSQLELRIIAHLSADKKLVNILNTTGDVFRTLAAELKMIDVNSVTTLQRQQAKQVFNMFVLNNSLITRSHIYVLIY